MVIKFTGSEDKEAREFLERLIETQQYKFEGRYYTLRTSEECNKSLFKDDSELSIFESSRNDPSRPRYAIAKMCVNVEDFLRSQALMKDVLYKKYKKSGNTSQVKRAKKGMKKGHKVPIPVLEFEKDGTLHNFQEGRHRSLAAMEMDIEYMPIFLAKKVKY